MSYGTSKYGLGPSGQFSYSSVVGMMLYLSGQTRSYITYEVNCCAHYMFYSRNSHELSLKRMCQYFKGTSTKGLILNPSKELCKIVCYPDADFEGVYSHENPTDQYCVKSRTGYYIAFENLLVLWKPKLQMDTYLSIM